MAARGLTAEFVAKGACVSEDSVSKMRRGLCVDRTTLLKVVAFLEKVPTIAMLDRLAVAGGGGLNEERRPLPGAPPTDIRTELTTCALVGSVEEYIRSCPICSVLNSGLLEGSTIETDDGRKVVVGRGNQAEIPPSPDQSGGIASAVDRFYTQALLQSKVWFLASVLAALVGLVVIVWEVVQATNRPTLDAVLKTTPGLLTETIAVLVYRQANATRRHAAELLTSTQGDRRSEIAVTVLNSIQDVERREEIAARLAMYFAGGSPAAPSKSGSSAISVGR